MKEEFARLDAFLVALINNPTNKGFIWISIGENETIEQTKRHIQKLLKHVRYRKFPEERLIFGIEKVEKLDSSVTTLWRFPEDADLPCERCEIIKAKDF